MNDLPMLYFTMERYLFPLLEEELGELTAKMREFCGLSKWFGRPGSSPVRYAGAAWADR